MRITSTTTRISILYRCDSTGNKNAAQCGRDENILNPLSVEWRFDIEASYVAAMGKHRAPIYVWNDLLNWQTSRVEEGVTITDF